MKKLAFFLLLVLFALPCKADDTSSENIFQVWTGNMAKTWRCKQYLDVYAPLNTWHNRLFYDKEHISQYNEMPWGGGLGVSRYDDDGDLHALYFMAFNDSNYHAQTIFGYAYQKNWYFGAEKDWNAGVGFTTSITQRQEYSYIPLPLPLPIAGVGFRNIAIQSAYVPGLGKNDGNVLFTWARVSF